MKDRVVAAKFQTRHHFGHGDLQARDEKRRASPRDPQQIKREIAECYAFVTCIDSHIGRLIDALEQSRQLCEVVG